MVEVLQRELALLGLAVPPDALQKFDQLAAELADWNTRVNLTTITLPEDVAIRHFVDSLSALLVLPPVPEGRPDFRVIDVGAGAGFPGLALALARPTLRLTLVEATGKKTAFIRHVVGLLELKNVEVLTGRAEDLAHDRRYRETYDFAVARALAPLPVLLELTLPFLARDGCLIAWKKADIADEIAASARALAVLGGRIQEERRLRLTGDEADRMLLKVEKVHPTPAAYPRRAGIPAKTPL